MATIKLLDCTLRDGGHINSGRFGKLVIKSVVEKLVSSKIDVIEIGFLWNKETDEDTAKFITIDEIKKYLPKDMGNTKLSVMADNVDLTNLEDYDGTVEYVRLSFRKNELHWAEKTAKIIIKKGYKCFINPIHGSALSDKEYLDIITLVNKIKPYGFSIVDTFGAMRQEDIGRLYYLIENNLDKDIVLGIHLHENLGLSYSLAQYILEIAAPTRNIVIDGSLYGMGKIPGNLCIEQIMDHLNYRYGCSYSTEPIYDAIDEYIMPIYGKTRWGYSVPYAISAQCHVHRTYAEYLSNEKRLRTKDIRRILNEIDREHAETFDENYIRELYIKYMDVEYDDKEAMQKLRGKIGLYNKVIIVAPGASIEKLEIDSKLLTDACLISVNFIYEKRTVDFAFFTNAKRLDYARNIECSKMIISSNLVNDVSNVEYVFSRNELVYHDDKFCDDSTLMLLNLLKRVATKEIYIAGFDGFNKEKNNFFEQSYERVVRESDYDWLIKKDILKESYSGMNITFLTKSLYS